MQGPINLGKVMSAHAKFRRAHASLVDKEVDSAGKFGVQHVHLHPTFRPRTRNLQKQTEYKVVRLKSGSVLRLRNRAKYAKSIDQGARPHMIAARRRRTLRFVWKGVVVFHRFVNHPGNKPYRFLYKATTAAGRVFETSMRSGMDRLAKNF